MSKNNFTMHYVIGRGGFGKVRQSRKLIILGVESRKEKNRLTLCHEGNVQSKNYYETICELSDE